MDAIDFDDEGDLFPGLGTTRVVAVRSDAGDQDLLDLVFAGAVEDERVVEARREEGLPVARGLALGPGERPIIGVAEGDDVAADPAPGRPDDRLERIGDDHGVLAPEPDARPAIPREFHRPESDTTRCTGGHPARRRSGVGGGSRSGSRVLVVLAGLACGHPGLPARVRRPDHPRPAGPWWLAWSADRGAVDFVHVQL